MRSRLKIVLLLIIINAEVAQLVERNLAKVEVAGSNLVFRSLNSIAPKANGIFSFTRVAEQVDAQDLKSCNPKRLYGFNSRPGYLFFLYYI